MRSTQAVCEPVPHRTAVPMRWVGLIALALATVVPLQMLGKRNQDIAQRLLDTAGLVDAFRMITPDWALQEE